MTGTPRRIFTASFASLSAMTSSAAGQPAPVGADVSFEDGRGRVALADAGPLTIYPIATPTVPLLVTVTLDEPLRAIRRAEINGTPVAATIDPSSPDRVIVRLDQPTNASTVLVSLVDAVGLDGSIRARIDARFGLLDSDFSGDGAPGLTDITGFIQLFTTQGDLGDMNADGLFDLADLTRFVGALQSGDLLANGAPFVSGPASAFAPAGGASTPYTFTIRDDFTPEAELSVGVESSDPSVVDPGSVVLTGDGGARTVTFGGAAGASGTSIVTLVVGDGSDTARFDVAVRVGLDQPPVARIGAADYLGVAPLSVGFDGRESRDGEGAIVSYAWEFGNGSTATGPLANQVFGPGQHRVTLTVTDTGGMTSSQTRVVSVAAAPWSPTPTVSEAEARRFLWQAAWGPTQEDVAWVMANGFEAWIDLQLAVLPTYMTETLVEVRTDPEPDPDDPFPTVENAAVFDDLCVGGSDQLRQRTAWALNQVIPINGRAINEVREQDRRFLYNTFLRNALPDPLSGSRGNYFDLLVDITYNGGMGEWLTYKFNRKEDPVLGINPDENYAREVIQLFSVGLFDLNPDGTLRRDVFGDPIDTYDNEDIRQFARIFTGLIDGIDYTGSDDEDDFMTGLPMRWNIWDHEFGPKQLLAYPGAPGGGFIPGTDRPNEQAADWDILRAIENLFLHPNHTPFLANLMIKRFTTSNPTPGYVRRVAAAYEGAAPHGSGVRGDLAAMVRAILLDDEARNPAYRSNPLGGKVLEPVLIQFASARTMGLFDPTAPIVPEAFVWVGDGFRSQTGQGFLDTPSVFNFYLPDFAPLNTPVSAAGFSAPELQIFDDYKAIAGLNEIAMQQMYIFDAFADFRTPFTVEAETVAEDPAALAQLFAARFDHGWANPTTVGHLASALAQITEPYDRVLAAILLTQGHPEFRVLR